MMLRVDYIVCACVILYFGHVLLFPEMASGSPDGQDMTSKYLKDKADVVNDKPREVDLQSEGAKNASLVQNRSLKKENSNSVPSETTDSLSRSELLLWMVDELAALPPAERLNVMKHLENILDAEIYENNAYINPIYLNDILTTDPMSRTSSLESDRKQSCTDSEHCHALGMYSKEYMKETQTNVVSKNNRRTKHSRREKAHIEMNMSEIDDFCDSPDCASGGEDYVDIDVSVYMEQMASRLLPEEIECPDTNDIIDELFYSSNKVNNIRYLKDLYNINKAIRDGKYLARHMPVLGNVHPIKIETFVIFS